MSAAGEKAGADYLKATARLKEVFDLGYECVKSVAGGISES